MLAGVAVADEEIDSGADLLVPGDMGIGNTTPAAVLVGALTGADVVSVVGRGSGARRVDDRIAALVAAWRAAQIPVVAVTNEVGSGIVPATAAGRRFRNDLGQLNQRIAAESDEVVLMVAGIALPLR